MPAYEIAQVYIQLKTRALGNAFDYRIPNSLSGRVRPGSVVLVPLGRQKVLGIVAGLKAESEVPPARLVDIEDVLEYPEIPEELIRLALWIGRYYYCSPASALSLVLPPGGLPALEKRVADGKTTYRLKPPPVRTRRMRFARLTQQGNDTGRSGLPAPQQSVLACLGKNGPMPVAALLKCSGTSSSPVNTLARHGLVELYEAEVRRDSLRYYGSQDVDQKIELKLNQEQQAALAAIAGRLSEDDKAGRSRPMLLRGVPGSGKTEVYLRAVESVVASGGASIVLVPEISLTNQAVARFQRRFGSRVGIMHSGLGPGERYDEYMRIRSGEVDVVIGPRSALFAPLLNLRLIVIDEENDSSFKQESEPRYDARRVAIERARLAGAALLYGSATPSMECFHDVTHHHILSRRATGASMPAVEIVDMRHESDPVFSRRLIQELDTTVAAGEKAILLLNRRGYAGYLQCGDCGYVWHCVNCEISLTVHSRLRHLRCHHCGYEEPLPHACPQCSSTGLRRWGVGTERLESELGRRFPEAAIFRLDADSTSRYGAGPRILQQFAATPRALLVGTQMVAKGHHFPEVTLAAVINADLSLQFPEFRAEEQTFSILLQLSGRSGRAERPGRVLIQTWNADIECIKMAAERGFEKFYASELLRRRRLDYPPFKRLVNVICQSRDADKPAKATAFLKEKLLPALGGAQLLGPAPLFRLQGWSRSHLLLKVDSVEETLAQIAPVIEHYREPFTARGVRIIVDVDPQWLS